MWDFVTPDQWTVLLAVIAWQKDYRKKHSTPIDVAVPLVIIYAWLGGPMKPVEVAAIINQLIRYELLEDCTEAGITTTVKFKGREIVDPRLWPIGGSYALPGRTDAITSREPGQERELHIRWTEVGAGPLTEPQTLQMHVDVDNDPLPTVTVTPGMVTKPGHLFSPTGDGHRAAAWHERASDFAADESDWVSAATLIAEGWAKNDSRLTKLRQRIEETGGPKIGRLATDADKQRLRNSDLKWVYHRLRVIQHRQAEL